MNFQRAFFDELKKLAHPSTERLFKVALDLEAERGEFNRYGDANQEIAAAKKTGRHVSLSSFKDIANTDAGSIKNLDDWHKKLEGYGRDADRRQKVIDLVNSNQDHPAIVRVKGGKRELVAGNSRLSLRQAMNLPGKIYEYDAP